LSCKPVKNIFMAGFPGKCADIQSASPSANHSSFTRHQNVQGISLPGRGSAFFKARRFLSNRSTLRQAEVLAREASFWRITPMKESYCGLCDTCQLDNPDFLEALTKVRTMSNNSPCIGGNIIFPVMKVFLFLNLLRALTGSSASLNALDAKGWWFKRMPHPPLCQPAGICSLF
jgi:hypothetical protein